MNDAPGELSREEREKYGRIAMGAFWEDHDPADAVAITRRWQQAAEAVIAAYLADQTDDPTESAE